MDARRYADHLAGDADRLAAAARAAGVTTPVPTCDGWTVRDLLLHLVGGDAWAREIVTEGMAGRITRVERREPDGALDGDALIEAFQAGAHALARTLTDADPATAVWTFSAANRTASFWQRRRAQEMAVHRYDAESAAGAPTPIDTELAVDGVDEFLHVFLPRLRERLAAVGDLRVHLHCTDAPGEWLIVQQGADLAVTGDLAEADVHLSGGASELLLFLWGRIPPGALEIVGDGARLAEMSAAITV